MKNTILALTICGVLLNPTFANGTELSKETLSQEPLTITKDEQPKNEQNKNVHLRTGLMMSGAKGFLIGALSWWQRDLYWTQKGFITAISTATNMGIDYLSRSYQEDMWHPKSKGDRAVALGKSILGTGSAIIITDFLMKWFFTSKLHPHLSALKTTINAFKEMLRVMREGGLLLFLFSAAPNICYQAYSYFKKPSEKVSEKTSDQKPSVQA